MFNVTQPVKFLFQAAISALQKQPIVNAVIDGDDIIYRDYVDISIAVGTPKARCPHLLLILRYLLGDKTLKYLMKYTAYMDI